jgi:ADP-ribosylglycohydrolase
MPSSTPHHPFITQTLNRKILGIMVGSALGDAIGLYTEFLPKSACSTAYPSHSFTLLPPATPFREDSHRDKFTPGDWTDDTDQSLLLILSWLHSFYDDDEGKRGKLDEHDVAERIRSWTTQGLRALDKPPLGIGQTIGRVVLNAQYLEDPVKVATDVWVKSNRNAAPNGSLMRTHIIGVIYCEESEDEVFEIATKVGRVTHVDPRCVVACCVQVGLVRGILRGEILCEEDVDAVVERAWEWVKARKEYINPERGDVTEELLDREEFRRHCYAETLEELQLDDARKMGYVYKCLGSVLLTLRKAMRREAAEIVPSGAKLFEDLIVDLIMEGGDADTNACVAGALLGGWMGYGRLPQHWVGGLHDREWLLRKCASILYRLELKSGEELKEMVENDKDTALDAGRALLSKKDLDDRERDFVMMILMKQKDRREAAEKVETAKKGGLKNWFK